MSETGCFDRYVAIGDSSTEGLDDPDGRGGYRGWADRLAEHVAREQTERRPLLYANLAVRGKTMRQVRDEQFEPALEMRPDLVTLFAGVNDAVRRGFDPERLARDLEHMQRRFIDSGATVLGFTMPDMSRVLPLSRLVADRVARLNEDIRRVSESTGALVVDLAAKDTPADPRYWSADGFHANSLGHEAIAATLARALGIEPSEEAIGDGLPPRPAAGRLMQFGRDARWTVRYFTPWLVRHARGRSSGDGRVAKRPTLRAVEVARS